MFSSNTSRVPGLLYCITVLAGLFSLMYVPKQLFVYQDMALTLQNIQAQELHFRWGIAFELLCYIAFLLLPIALYLHLSSYHKIMANIMVGLVLVAVPLSCLAVGAKLNMLSIIHAQELELAGQIRLLKRAFLSYGNTMKLAKIFWGLWLIPFAYLGWISGKIPKLLCVFLLLGGLGYQINVFGGILIADFKSTGISKFAKLPSTIGEIGTCLWLLVMGIRKEPH